MKLWNADDGTYVNIVLITLENEMKNNTRRIGHEKKTLTRMKDSKFEIIETR